MDANEIRKKFIEDNAEVLLDELEGVLKGTGEFSSKSNVWLNYAFARISNMVDAADDIKVVEAESTKEVLAALSKGRITTKEAKELMQLLKLQSEADGSTTIPQVGAGVQFILHKDYKEEEDASSSE